MELPCRARDDILLSPGELTAIRRRLRNVTAKHDLATVIACAFDHRTRMLPFIYADMRMVPAGVRAIGSAMVDAGFAKTRIVLQQWNRNFRPSQMKLDGRVPDIFMVSSMQLHSEPCLEMIRDACKIDPATRPLIIAGGPKTIYEPWDVFSDDPDAPWGADVAVTGEEYVLLNLLEVVLSTRAAGESMRSAFLRARDSGALDSVPGLVYARGTRNGPAEELVDTGIQRLVGDLDELPDPVLGYGLLEPPGRGTELSPGAVEAGRVRRLSPISSVVFTMGCKFSCPYCPIPAYNQRQFRTKSGDRIADEMIGLHKAFGLRQFFGTDDNFFNDHARAIAMLETLASRQCGAVPLRKVARLATEATVHDTLQLRDYLPLARRAGLRALWLGVEDMTGSLVSKGQTPDKTIETFRLLRQVGIAPMPMMMHHDAQKLYTPGRPDGLINQVRLLQKAGASGMQVLMITPSLGSKLYMDSYASGLVYSSVAGRPVEMYMIDGNYVVASRHDKPWRKQLNILAAYLLFYNPIRLLWSFVRTKGRVFFPELIMQTIGMFGLVHTVRRTLGWALRLAIGPIERTSGPPISRIPMRSIDGGRASHALPGTPIAENKTRATPAKHIIES